MKIIDYINEMFHDISILINSNEFSNSLHAHIFFGKNSVMIGGRLRYTGTNQMSPQSLNSTSEQELHQSHKRLTAPYSESPIQKQIAISICKILLARIDHAIINKDNISNYQSTDSFFHIIDSVATPNTNLNFLLSSLGYLSSDDTLSFASEFLENKQNWPAKWSEQYQSASYQFTTNTKVLDAISQEDEIIGKDFFKKPQTLLDIISLQSSHQYYYAENHGKILNQWINFIERKKLLSISPVQTKQINGQKTL